MPLSRLLTHSSWIRLDFSQLEFDFFVRPSYSNSKYFMNFLINASGRRQGRRRQKFTCKVASCDNDGDAPSRATTIHKNKRKKKCQGMKSEAKCVATFSSYSLALPLFLLVFPNAIHNLSLKLLLGQTIRNFDLI